MWCKQCNLKYRTSMERSETRMTSKMCIRQLWEMIRRGSEQALKKVSNPITHLGIAPICKAEKAIAKGTSTRTVQGWVTTSKSVLTTMAKRVIQRVVDKLINCMFSVSVVLRVVHDFTSYFHLINLIRIEGIVYNFTFFVLIFKNMFWQEIFNFFRGNI